MNKFDWYYKQRVSQGHMDQAFGWAEQADHDMVVDADLVGLLSGGVVSEQAPTPDLTVNVSALTAHGKDGERIAVALPSSTVDVSQDEYGTPTEVTTAGHERIISVFVRFYNNLTEPRVDGNGLTVYSQQLEDAEIFVRMGVSAPTGSAVPPALLTNALLLADITRAYGQGTILTSYLSLTRREDWVRETWANDDPFVHGTAKSAIQDLFSHVDAIEQGDLDFTFGETWFNGVAVGLGTPPTTIKEALDAIPDDLNSTGVGGANLIGTQPITGWGVLLLTDNSAFGGVMTNADGGTAEVYDVLTGTPGYVLVHSIAGTWTPGAGVKDGASYSDPPDAYILGYASIDSILTTSTSVQGVLAHAMEELAARPRIEVESPVTAARYHYARVINERYQVPHSDVGGGGDPHGALATLATAPKLTTTPSWGLPYLNTVALGSGFDAVDICRGWDYARNAHCAYLCGALTDVRKVWMDPDTGGGTGYLASAAGQLTIDTSGTLLSTLANHEPYAIACNGPYLFVLVQTSAAGATAKVYCYDVRYWPGGGPLHYVWDTAVPSTTNCMGPRKADSRLLCDDTYVYGLLGAEDANTGTPLFRMDALTGLNPILGKGDGRGATGYTPTGGLAITDDNVLFYTVDNTTLQYAIPATGALASTGKGDKQLSGICRDILIPGRFAVFPCQTLSGVTYFRVYAWEYAGNVLYDPLRIDNVYDGAIYADVQASYDGSTMWIKFCDDAGHTAENHAMIGLHPGQIVAPNIYRLLACEDRYAVTAPITSGSVGTMGRMLAWGPGIWTIAIEDASDHVGFLPLTRTFK